MMIDELTNLLPPVRHAGRKTPHDWGDVTRRLLEPLPTDFMQFIDAYGSVELNDYIVIFNPFSKLATINFFEGAFSCLGVLRTLKKDAPELVPAPLYYENGGLLPWGVSSDGDIYCWVTQGISGRWTVAVVCRDGSYESFPMSMTQFLARVFSGKIQSHSMPDEVTEAGTITLRDLDAIDAAS